MQISQMLLALVVSSACATMAAAGTLRAVDVTPRRAGGVFTQQSLTDNEVKIQASTIELPDYVEAIPQTVAKWKNESSFPKALQLFFVFAWVFLLGSAPFVFPIIDNRPVTKTQVTLAASTVLVLVGGFYLFTNVILFQSSHFEGHRTLTVTECIYFMAQTITTVGYGDIGPAKTRGQIFVGLYVMFSLFVIAMVVEDFTQHVVYAASEYKKKWRREEVEDILASGREQAQGEQHAVNMSSLLAPQKPHLKSLYTALAVFAFFDITFIMFFTFYPGEGKTLFEATYMSLITLGTVGFGFFTPVTEAGMVFNAFWMVAGCSALVAVIGEFTCLMYQLNEYERHNKAESKMESMLTLKNIANGSDKITAVDFLQFCLVQSKKVDQDEIDNILKVFQSLNPKDGAVDMMAIQQASTPRQMIVT